MAPDVVLVPVGEQKRAEVGRSRAQNGKSGRRSRPPASCRREQEAGVDEQRGAAVVEQHCS